MSFVGVQTPVRTQALPGAYLQTPAPRQPLFRTQPTSSSPSSLQRTQQPSGSVQGQVQAQVQATHMERARRSINEFLQKDALFPELDTYVKQGVSSDYDVPTASQEAAWAPYQKSRMYDIPDKVFEQYNQAQVSTAMGLFAELNHAWITIDNALYLWDYTNPNPELVGYEDQNNTITSLKLLVPRRGVFVDAVTHVLVVATTSEIILLGIGAFQDTKGVWTVKLYSTGMSLALGGIRVSVISGSTSTGRIFFGSSDDNELYELTYQQEEKWFASRCGKVNHTSSGYAYLVPTIIRGRKEPEHVEDIVVDDTRQLVYTLSSESSIRTFHMDTPKTLQQVIEKRQKELLQDISHMSTQTPLLGLKTQIVSISTISANESLRIHLMATTSSGCRLFLSATRGVGYLGNQGAPKSMQVQHVKFPPREIEDGHSGPQGQLVSYQGDEQPTVNNSRSLQWTRRGLRFPPGFMLFFVAKDIRPDMDTLFMSAPDTGRIASRAREEAAQGSRYYEQGLWVDLGSRAEDVGLVSRPFAAADTPRGFGNELTMQLDEPATEIAILTNTGVHTMRRRRLIDIFAAAIRQNASDEGFEGEIRTFIRRYGRSETTAAALAVACGQAADMSTGDSRVARILDPETLELARKAFIEFGGNPVISDNAVDGGFQPADNVRPSARYEAIALFISRIARSIWKAPVMRKALVGSQLDIKPQISISKLSSIQAGLIRLKEFLEKNRTFIEGLSGPESLQRVASRQEEIALQGEHQALSSLQKLMVSIIEGIAFVMMLFDERMDQIWASLDENTRNRLQTLSFELLFSSEEGKDIAKILVKAIVNRNIANGSNVDTVAEALRRRCGSFCSADDVIIFRAQEQLKKASEAGANSDTGRHLLNESLRLFGEVAGSLTFENLQASVTQFANMQFYAGAIQLCLTVAAQSDRGNTALAWFNDGKSDQDPRKAAFDSRKRCYNLIHSVLNAVDDAFAGAPALQDGRTSLMSLKRNEAYNIISNSDDQVFQFDLYDWYLEQGWTDRLLAVQSPYVVTYLQHLSSTRVQHADLLWKYYTNLERYYDAAMVQLQLAKSDFPLSLGKRIEYLSRARANASANVSSVGRQMSLSLQRDITNLLDVANIQDDLLQRLKADPRLSAERRAEILPVLDGQVQGLTELYNDYAEQANYSEVCLLIYQAADYRNPAHISATWQQLLDGITQETLAERGDGDNASDNAAAATELPYEAVITAVRGLAHRLGLSESTFPPATLVPMVEGWAAAHQRGVGPATWVPDLFLDVGVAHADLLAVLERMLYSDEAPFRGAANRRVLAAHMLYVIGQWYHACRRENAEYFGGGEEAKAVKEMLLMLTRNGLDADEVREAQELLRRIERGFR